MKNILQKNWAEKLAQTQESIKNQPSKMHEKLKVEMNAKKLEINKLKKDLKKENSSATHKYSKISEKLKTQEVDYQNKKAQLHKIDSDLKDFENAKNSINNDINNLAKKNLGTVIDQGGNSIYINEYYTPQAVQMEGTRTITIQGIQAGYTFGGNSGFSMSPFTNFREISFTYNVYKQIFNKIKYDGDLAGFRQKLVTPTNCLKDLNIKKTDLEKALVLLEKETNLLKTNLEEIKQFNEGKLELLRQTIIMQKKNYAELQKNEQIIAEKLKCDEIDSVAVEALFNNISLNENLQENINDNIIDNEQTVAEEDMYFAGNNSNL